MTRAHAPRGALKGAVRREVLARREAIVGRVVSHLRLTTFDGSPGGGPTWVVDVDAGDGRRVLRDVPVKAGADGARFYAQLGQSVLLRRNAAGRFDVVGPADRVPAPAVAKEYDPATGAEVSSATEGLTTTVEPFTHLQGTGAPNSKWGDGVTPFVKVTVRDGEGNEV